MRIVTTSGCGLNQLFISQQSMDGSHFLEATLKITYKSIGYLKGDFSSYIIHPEIRSNFNFKGKGGRGQPWSDHTPVCPVISGVLRCLSDHHLGHEFIVNINREEAGSLGTSWWSGCCTIDREVQYYIKFRQPCGRCTYLGWKSSPFKNLQK